MDRSTMMLWDCWRTVAYFVLFCVAIRRLLKRQALSLRCSYFAISTHLQIFTVMPGSQTRKENSTPSSMVGLQDLSEQGPTLAPVDDVERLRDHEKAAAYRK